MELPHTEARVMNLFLISQTVIYFMCLDLNSLQRWSDNTQLTEHILCRICFGTDQNQVNADFHSTINIYLKHHPSAPRDHPQRHGSMYRFRMKLMVVYSGFKHVVSLF